MTPKAAQGGRAIGTSFKGVFDYLQHDKRLEGEEVRTTSDRVEWQAFRNLATDNPDMAWRVMRATANQQDALKRDAGQSAAGNKSDKVVFHYSLGWHPDEAKGLTKAEMLRAADESLRAIGAQGHQAAIIAHNDTAHPHVHVVVNRVDPTNGKMLDLWKYQQKLSKWAMAYEQERGKVWCENRVENWKRRDLGEVFSADRGAAYHHHDQAQALGHANDNDSAKILAEQKAKDAALAKKGEIVNKVHSKQWKDLSAWYKVGKDKIAGRDVAGRPTPFRKAIDDVKAQFKPNRSYLGKRQYAEFKEFEKAEKHLLGKLENAVKAAKLSKEIGQDERGAQTSLFNFLISSSTRRAALEKMHRLQWRTLNSAQKAEIGKAIDKVKADQDAAYAKHRERFNAKRTALKADQDAERQELKQEWQNRKIERTRAFEVLKRQETMRKEEIRAPEAEKAKARPDFNRAARGKRKRRGRSRSRKFED